jgi:hypothetical protein
MGMGTLLFNSFANTPSSLIRRLAWPATVSIVLAAITACGGSSTGDLDHGPSAGAGGTFHFGGASSTAAGRNSGTSGSPAENTSGGKPGFAGGSAIAGDSSSGPDEPGNGAAGEPGDPKPGDPKPGDPKPGDPPKPPLGVAGAGGEDADCPLQPPADKAACIDDMLKCDYPDIACKCGGPEDDRKWTCKAPPNLMKQCPPMPPVAASVCKTADPPLAPCHYEEPTIDCTCAANKWVCAVAP